MSDFKDSRPRTAGAVKVNDFQPEVFPALERSDPLPDPHEDFQKDAPPRPPAPDPFEEFEVDRRPVSAPLDDLPSLDGLFRPFALEGKGPVIPEPYEDLCDIQAPQDYVYEDLDTRDPEVVRTLAQAEEKGREMIAGAEEQAHRILDGARTEARGLAGEAEAEAAGEVARARREAEVIVAAAEKIQAAAAEVRVEAETLRAGAEARAAEVEAGAAELAEREEALELLKQALADEAEAQKAGLEDQRADLEADFAKRKGELDAEREKILAEAAAAGRAQGLERGREEGRAEGRAQAQADFQDRVEGLLAVFAKMEGLYNDLWAANGPMMVQLALEAAGRILNKHLDEDRDLAARAFEACIEFLSQAHRVVFIARPQDIAQLEQARADQRERLGALVKVSFQPDETLGPGDLIMESDVGRLDATVKHRAAQVMDVLRKAFESRETAAPPEPDAEPDAVPDPAGPPENPPEPAEPGPESESEAAEPPPS